MARGASPRQPAAASRFSDSSTAGMPAAPTPPFGGRPASGLQGARRAAARPGLRHLDKRIAETRIRDTRLTEKSSTLDDRLKLRPGETRAGMQIPIDKTGGVFRTGPPRGGACDEDVEGTRWMPWHRTSRKDVASCDKLR